MINRQNLIRSLCEVILEKTGDFIAIVDKNGDARYFNQTAKQLTGISPDETAANSWIWEKIFVNQATGLKLLNICRNFIKNQRNINIRHFQIFDQNRNPVSMEFEFRNVEIEPNEPGALIIGKRIFYQERFDENDPDLKYLNIFLNAPIGFFRSLPEGQFLEANQAFASMLEFESPEEILRKVNDISNQIYFHPSLRKEILTKTLSSKKLVTVESTFKTKSGKPVNVRINVKAKFDKEIDCTVLEGTIENISEITRDRAALKKSEHELTSLFSAMKDLVFIFDKNGTYEYIAPTNPELLIAPADDLKGKNIFDFLPRDVAETILAKIQHCAETKQTVEIIYPISINNKKYWFEGKFSPLSHHSVIAVVRDISDRIAKHQVVEIMLNIARAVGITDEIDELFDLIRKEISRLIETKNFFIALYDADKHALRLPYFRDEKDSFDYFPAEKTLSSLVLKERKSMLLNEKQIDKLAKMGKIKIVGTPAKVWLGIPLLVEGEVLGIMAVQDYNNEAAINKEHQQLLEMISPQISLSIFRKQAEKELRESNQTKDRFFSIIAHDLKNPFNAIIGFTALLLDEWTEFDDEDKVSMISSIKSSSEGAYELLMNLLEWSRLHVGKLTYEPEFIDYSSLIRINFLLLKANAEKKNIRLISSGDCDKMVWVDPNMIKTVIRNLITNAIKFTPENGTIRVECKKDTKYPGMFILSVTDNGIGMKQQEMETIFDLNKSTTSTGTHGETGTGLGLLLCKEFVEKNSGKIWVDSNVNGGSTFYIALPSRPKI